MAARTRKTVRDPRADELKQMTEAEWQGVVVNHAMQAGWLVYFIPDGMWRRAFVSKTPQKLGNRGFPDLVMVGHGQVLFRELKKVGGKMSQHQMDWRDALIEGGADWDLWFPTDLDGKVMTEIWGDRTDLDT